MDWRCEEGEQEVEGLQEAHSFTLHAMDNKDSNVSREG